MNKIRVGIVNYLNTKPLLWGLEREPVRSMIELYGTYPSRLARMLKDDEIDLGLIPVAVIPELEGCFVVGNYCIGAKGEVASVCLFSEVPLQEIEIVYLDYQSRSSAALLQWLMREYWNISPQLIHAEDESFREKIKGTAAGLVIGDRAFEQRKRSTFFYDLSSEWKKITGLPFVFAAWVSNKKLPHGFIDAFDKANAMGLAHLDEIVAAAPGGLFDLKRYYTLHISYELDADKRKGMELFLNKIEVVV